MTERPIIFNTEMVKAILDGRKTQTRRVIKNPYVQCPYGQIGDRLWVRERHYIYNGCGRVEKNIRFYADNKVDDSNYADFSVWKPKPSIFMPKKYARIWLEIIDIKVERVQDISESDARAEGIIDGGCLGCGNSEPCGCIDPEPDARDSFIFLWNSINKKRECGWEKNPFVWVVEFKRID